LHDRFLGDNSEKSGFFEKVILLMRQIRCCRESHYAEKLVEKLWAELPPGMPYEILRSGQETAHRRSFQIWPEQIGDNEQPRHLSALLNDPERIAAV
jgi:hypothetical protein